MSQNKCFACIYKNCAECEIPMLDVCKDCRFKKSYEQIAEMRKIIERMKRDIRRVL